MNQKEATRLETAIAMLLIAQATDVMEQHYDEGDVEAAIQAVFARAIEIMANKSLRPIEELFQ